MRPHRNLDAWIKSVDFVVAIYEITKTFPQEEKFGLTSQIRRASVSISSNIAEGAGRKSDREFLQFLSHSQGSASEVDTQLFIALRLKFINETDYRSLEKSLDDIGRMITGLSNHLKRKIG
jgi:four helix bundle protein